MLSRAHLLGLVPTPRFFGVGARLLKQLPEPRLRGGAGGARSTGAASRALAPRSRKGLRVGAAAGVEGVVPGARARVVRARSWSGGPAAAPR